MKTCKRFSFIAASVIIGIIVASLISEISLRAINKDRNKYFVLQPNLKKTLKIKIGILPGVSGDSNFLTNSDGMRGDEIPRDYTSKILAIGGSTTECLYLDQKKTWPYLLQQLLNDNGKAGSYWVGNVGRSGHTSVENYLQLKYLLEQYQDIKTVIYLAGVNDFLKRLSADTNYMPKDIEQPTEEDLHRAFVNVPRFKTYRDLALYKLLRNIYDSIEYRKLLQDTADVYIRWRLNRQSASELIDNLPDLSSSLNHYKYNLHHIIDLAKSHGVRLIFMTQPFLWKDNMAEEEKKLLWTGGIGDYQRNSGRYYSTGALAEGMDIYNKALIDVCKKRNAEYIDLSNIIPRDVTSFYDDVHFNENGARSVARAIFFHLVNPK
jgi:lysophospholipase L1-like esterase